MPDPATLDAEGDDDVVGIPGLCEAELGVDSQTLASQSCEREGSTRTRIITASFVYVQSAGRSCAEGGPSC